MKKIINPIFVIMSLLLVLTLSNCNFLRMKDIQIDIENNSDDTQNVELFDTVSPEPERFSPVSYISQTGIHPTYIPTSSNFFGQSFLATKNTTIKKIELSVHDVWSGNDIVLRIYEGLPGTAVTLLREYTGLTIAANSINQFDVDFDIVTGETYSFLVKGYGPEGDIRLRSDNTVPYTEGSIVYYDGSDLLNYPAPDHDLYFVVYEEGALITNINANSGNQNAYNKLNNSIQKKPIYLCEMKLECDNPEQFLELITLRKDTLFGQRSIIKRSIIRENKGNKNLRIADIKFDENIQLGGDDGNILGFTILPNSQISLLLKYNKEDGVGCKEFKKAVTNTYKGFLKKTTENTEVKKAGLTWWPLVILVLGLYVIYKVRRNKKNDTEQ